MLKAVFLVYTGTLMQEESPLRLANGKNDYGRRRRFKGQKRQRGHKALVEPD